MSSVAIAVFVKDEASDIATWIAWYIVNGADILFIYDDHSTDGTWEIVQAAAKVYNIVALRTDLAVEHFFNRQRASYMDAIRRSAGRHDWIGLFDADEYCFIEHEETYGEFLERFADAQAVAISWCVYGSSGLVTRPSQPVPEAFVQHSQEDFPHNIHVKSFVRPECVGAEYINPHRFAVLESRYTDTYGRLVTWTHPGGFQADWGRARVMHYVCRSMEHFVARMKRRFDIREYGTKYWQDFDRNEEVKVLSYELRLRLYSAIWLIEAGRIADSRTSFEEVASLLPDRTDSSLEVAIEGPFTFVAPDGAVLSFNLVKGEFQLVKAAPDPDCLVVVKGMICRTEGARPVAFLFTDGPLQPLFRLNTGQKGEMVAGDVMLVSEGSVALHDLRSLDLLVSGDGCSASSSQLRPMSTAAEPEALPLLASLKELASGGLTAVGFAKAMALQRIPINSAAAAAWAFALPERERALLQYGLRPMVLPDWVFSHGRSIS